MSLVRHTAVQASLTFASRILGFVRDIILAAKIGAGPVGDAWATAQQFPNLFRRIFAEGAFSSAFVPTYARTLEAEGPEAARAVADDAMRVLFAATAGLTILAQIFMPWVLLIIHGGQAGDTVNYNLAVLMTRITMPYLTFMAIAALLSGVLNSLERFVLSAGAPTLLNLCLIPAGLLGTTPQLTAIYAAIAFFIAGLLQAGALWWGVSRQGVKLSLIGWPRLTPAVKKVLMLALPGTIAASGTQINIIVSQSLASFEVGAKSWLYAADRLYQLPLGLVGVAVGVAILPRLSRAARAGDTDAGARTMDEGIGLAMALTFPAAAGLMLAPVFLIDAFFVRGAFLASDAAAAGAALFHFAWGVPAFVLIKVLAPPYFAREDTKTPMRFALASVAINTLLGAGLFFWLKSSGAQGFPGLAIATSTAAWFNAGLLALTLARRGWYRPGPRLAAGLIRAALATAILSAGIALMLWQFPAIQAALYGSKSLAAAVLVLGAAVIYGAAALITGALRPGDIRQALRR
ncbi:MAG: murein biosynthesis integral membrane protein MurJ [Hyphomonas sp.]|uniref:murein biosynthesis integral membrane protein MurJ n=1 Tax=Hyphomonas sp. TaxID=87 RepID=UPI001803F28D|nr:murein biosynthesis integral membrane protein MurJ [Hyphomonas sp.]MBA3068300.1 murein biosynthesis integral membrane protein MurJ [Hyphomonas sp.]MBU3922364.1 murein biosynthesis integral membrane protein MurJ [Alphaproteobacteria bacterium]MBU4060834.1 murein biosynthesis integral membrane protein MurJ [Alphaproteobacteria bacterium]MBU4164818.1 murein biosynthesis integral membrane protein MurJ [Alphaproteobacteria bacterium]